MTETVMLIDIFALGHINQRFFFQTIYNYVKYFLPVIAPPIIPPIQNIDVIMENTKTTVLSAGTTSVLFSIVPLIQDSITYNIKKCILII